jgi:hypothetical protein
MGALVPVEVSELIDRLREFASRKGVEAQALRATEKKPSGRAC